VKGGFPLEPDKALNVCAEVKPIADYALISLS